jgi:hypothetical protein
MALPFFAFSVFLIFWYLRRGISVVEMFQVLVFLLVIAGGGYALPIGRVSGPMRFRFVACKKYLDLQPRAPDRSTVEQFLAWVSQNRPPANVRRWIVVNPP